MRSDSACRRCGDRSTIASNSRLPTRHTSSGVAAVTVAERRSPVSSAASPTTLPAPTCTGSGAPSFTTLAVPLSMKYSASPASP